MTDPIKAKIIEAVPEIAQQECRHRLMADENGCPFGTHERPITLADVLRAIPWSYIVDTKGGFWNWPDQSKGAEPTGVTWNLALPLDEQESEVVEFLAKVLGV